MYTPERGARAAPGVRPRACRGEDRPLRGGGRRAGPVPAGALDALPRAMHAVHVPEDYGGEGADALAAVIVIEEVARVCASSSLIPAVNKLGTVPLLLSGVGGAQAEVPAAASHAARRMFSYAFPRRAPARTPPR